MILKEWLVLKIQEEWLFKYKVEWAAVDLLNNFILLFLFISKPKLQINFSLFEVISNERHPDWYFFDYLKSGEFPISIIKTIFLSLNITYPLFSFEESLKL